MAVLAVASIPLSQSRMDNGRLRVKLDDGTHRDVILRDPETIDDWLGSGLGKPYALGGHPVALGKNAHGHLYEIDLGGVRTIQSIELETFTNKTVIRTVRDHLDAGKISGYRIPAAERACERRRRFARRANNKTATVGRR